MIILICYNLSIISISKNNKPTKLLAEIWEHSDIDKKKSDK